METAARTIEVMLVRWPLFNDGQCLCTRSSWSVEPCPADGKGAFGIGRNLLQSFPLDLKVAGDQDIPQADRQLMAATYCDIGERRRRTLDRLGANSTPVLMRTSDLHLPIILRSGTL